MSLTTRAKVLQTLNLTDDATTAAALAVAFDPATASLTQVVFAVNADQTTLTVTPTPGSATVFSLVSTSYDTMTELATGIEALTGIEANAVVPTGTTLASSLLDVQTVTLTTSNTLGQLTYSNVAAGTVAAFIDQLIDDVDAEIERYCNRTFATATFTEKYDGDGTPFLQLLNYPVTSVTSISWVSDTGTLTAYPTNTYRYEGTTGRVQLNNAVQAYGGGASGPPGYAGFYGDYGAYGTPAYTRGWINAFPEGFQNVQVVYVGGYSTIPADLSRVATEMVVDLYLNRRTNPRAGGESVAPVSVSFMPMSDQILKWAERLAPFVRPSC